jgi:alpha/beta superfamily hydrolase
MVTQAEQSVKLATSDGLSIEGVLHLPESTPSAGIVVSHPRPQFGGDMHNNVVMTICSAALDCGIAALRFNFRGVGASEGSYDGGKGERQDVAAALGHLRDVAEVDSSRVGLAGYSFGAAVVLWAVDENVKALITVSTPTSLGTVEAPSVACPALFVSGDADEYNDPQSIRKLAEESAGEAEAVIVPGVNHFWSSGDGELRAAVGEFLAKHLR